MAIDPTSPFVWGAGGAPMTPQAAEAQRKVAQALMMQGADYSPVRSPWQGAARVAQALTGGFESGQADASDRRLAEMQPQMMAAALSGMFPGAGGTPAAQPTPSGAAAPMGATAIPSGGAEFTNSVMPLAQQASDQTGIDPRLITAQAALETGYGKSAPGNNLFGIKSHGQPGGNVLPTTEIVNGQPVRTSDSFAAYATPADSVNGYSNFMLSNPRYKPTMAAPTLEGQAAALGQSGYATDPNYGQKVLQIAQGLPAPTGGVLADNSPSPLDNAQYPAGPVGAPTATAGASPAKEDDAEEASLPANSQPAQFVVPGQGEPPAAAQPAQPASMAKIAPLISLANSPYASPATKQIAGVLLSSQLSAIQKANDPMTALDLQSKQLAIKKTQQDLDKPDWEWKPIGRDANGEWSYGFVNSKTQETRDRFNQPIAQNQPPTEDPNAGLNGEDYLKAIPRDRGDIARKVANGEVDVASLPNRGNYRMQILSDAARFDPTFNPADYKTRLATRKDFTSGKSAQNITSFNTAIGHLDTLDRSIDPLGNRGSSWYNSATAPLSMQTDGHYQTAVKDFRVAKQAVADELSRAFKGAGGTVHDISEWEKTINEADSPEALHAATKKAVDLLHSRIDAVGDQYNRGMGKTTDPVSLLSPKAQATLNRLEGRGGEAPQGAPPAPSGVDPGALAEARRRGLIK